MPFELGLAAFHAVHAAGLLAQDLTPTPIQIERVLQVPISAGTGTRRYRFPKQRAEWLSGALAFLDGGAPPAGPLAVRDWLRGAPGIGPKTASWIVRNHFDCDDVAILDVHVMRAGVAAGVFDTAWSVNRDYELIERFFVAWAVHGNVPVSDLDAVIWSEEAARTRLSRRNGRDPLAECLLFG